MSDSPIIDLLIVDRSLSDIENITQALRSADYVVQTQYSDEAEAQDHILYKPLDLVMVRVAEQLEILHAVCDYINAAEKDIPVIAIVDDQQLHKPVALLKAGADNFFELGDIDHLLLVIKKELAFLNLRREARSLERRAEETETRSRSLLASAPDAIAYIHEGAHAYANPTYLSTFGYENEDVLAGVPFINMVAAEDRDQLKNLLRKCTKTGAEQSPVEMIGLRSDGESFPIQVACAPTRIDDEPCMQVIIRSAAQQAQHAQIVQSGLDEFTGLLSRQAFIQHLSEICQRGERKGAVLYILLTDYRSIVEQLGLIAIDQLLRDVAQLLRDLVSDQEMVARFSDAAFVIYTPATEASGWRMMGERICAAIANHNSHAVKSLVSSAAAIGISSLAEDEGDEMQILTYADRACELARQQGQNNVHVYSHDPYADSLLAASNESAGSSSELLEVLRDAIASDRMSLLYQPIASFQDASTERYKAYLQVFDADRVPLTQQLLEYTAESNNLMWQLDRWVIVQVLEALAKRYQKQQSLPVLFAGISGNSITDDTFCTWLKRRFEETGLPGSALVIEIKEETAEAHFEKLSEMRERLGSMGCGVALTEFGGKTNSERLFREIKPDFVKLSGKLFEKLSKGRDERARKILTSLTDQAREQDSHMIASGISNASQMASLWQFGITAIEGDMVREPRAKMDFNFQDFVAS